MEMSMSEFPSYCWIKHFGKTQCQTSLSIVLSRTWHFACISIPTKKREVTPRRSDIPWGQIVGRATTPGRQVWHLSYRKGSPSTPNNNNPTTIFPKKSPFCWIPTHFKMESYGFLSIVFIILCLTCGTISLQWKAQSTQKAAWYYLNALSSDGA